MWWVMYQNSRIESYATAFEAKNRVEKLNKIFGGVYTVMFRGI